MQFRFLILIAVAGLMHEMSPAAKPISPGIAALGIHADLHEFDDGGSAVKVLKVIPNSPAQRLFDHSKTPASGEPYQFYTLEKDDLIVAGEKNTGTAAAPIWTTVEIKNIKDLKLLLHGNLGKLIRLKIKTPKATAGEYTEQTLQVKVAELPVQ